MVESCKFCGRQLEGNPRFCDRCGAAEPVVRSADVSYAMPKEAKKLGWFLTLGATVLGAVYVLYLSLGRAVSPVIDWLVVDTACIIIALLIFRDLIIDVLRNEKVQRTLLAVPTVLLGLYVIFGGLSPYYPFLSDFLGLTYGTVMVGGFALGFALLFAASCIGGWPMGEGRYGSSDLTQPQPDPDRYHYCYRCGHAHYEFDRHDDYFS